MTLVYIYVALASYNTGSLTLPMSSIENMVDEAADIAALDQHGKINRKGNRDSTAFLPQDAMGIEWKTMWNEGTDAVMDVPVGGVCEILYEQD